jgi:hypothetical protein
MVTTMKATNDKRELLRHYALLSDQARKRVRVLGGLFGSIDLLQTLLRLFWDLNTRLEQIDEQQNALASELDKVPESEPVWPDLATTELVAATLALGAVLKTIDERGLTSQALERLYNALFALACDSSPPGMLTPTERTSRPADAPAVQAAKGMLAAALHVRQKVHGESRKVAAEWVVQHTPKELIFRISRKPISWRTVIEWLDRFGGKHAAPGSGRDAFIHWSEIFGRWSANRSFTGSLLNPVAMKHARDLPALAA